LDIILTIKTQNSTNYYDISVPSTKPLIELESEIVSLLHFYDKDFYSSNKINYFFSKKLSKQLNNKASLLELGIKSGDTLIIS
jgi:hypothetical protein